MRLPNGACRGHIRFRSAHEELRLYFLFMNSARILVLVYSCPLFIFKKKEKKSQSCCRAKENLDLVCEEKQFILNRCTVQWILSSDETVRAFTTWSRDFRARLAK